jgi:hypothetical protein
MSGCREWETDEEARYGSLIEERCLRKRELKKTEIIQKVEMYKE